MADQHKPVAGEKESRKPNVPPPVVGEPLDGRHYLDVVEEQQYAGKPFVKKDQDEALGRKEARPSQPESDR